MRSEKRKDMYADRYHAGAKGSGDGYVIEFWIWKLFLQCAR